jgi:hypothetical protein
MTACADQADDGQKQKRLSTAFSQSSRSIRRDLCRGDPLKGEPIAQSFLKPTPEAS